MRALAAIVLVIEGLSTGLTTAARVPSLIAYPVSTLVVIMIRGLLGLLQFASGWIVIRRIDFGARLGRWTILASACLVTLELGAGLAPTSLFHAYRWPAVAAYWVYAAVLIWMLRGSKA